MVKIPQKNESVNQRREDHAAKWWNSNRGTGYINPQKRQGIVKKLEFLHDGCEKPLSVVDLVT